MIPSYPTRRTDASADPNASPPQPHAPQPPSYLSSGSNRATVHFWVHAQMPEVKAFAEEQGWLAHGWDNLAISWQEMHYTTDGWKTTRVLKSTEVPSPVINGHFYLPFVVKGDKVEFAVQVGIAARTPGDTSGERASGVLWFNGDGQNYRQTAR